MAEKIEKKEESKNCPACKKIMKKAKRYFRNGYYYCNKNCYQIAAAKKADVAKEAKETEEAK